MTIQVNLRRSQTGLCFSIMVAYVLYAWNTKRGPNLNVRLFKSASNILLMLKKLNLWIAAKTGKAGLNEYEIEPFPSK